MSQPPRKRGGGASKRGASPAAPRNVETELLEEADLEFTLEELREFLSADFAEIEADPAFKDELREKLLHMIRTGAFGYGRDED